MKNSQNTAQSTETTKPVGRPLNDSVAATGHIHLRITMERKGWYVRYARLHGRTLADWIQQTCDAECEYPPNPKQYEGHSERV